MELVQLKYSRPPEGGQPTRPLQRKPAWLKVKAPGGPNYVELKRLMRDQNLHTVCEEAHCPNIGECWEHRTASFMVLGDVCTRNCAYCAVSHGTPLTYDAGEPQRLAEAVARMDLRHVVITSVDRDDLPNGGAEIFAGCVTEIRKRCDSTSIELLIPDFKGSDVALALVTETKPDILNHNLETVERLYRIARPGGRYKRALRLLRQAKELNPELITKSGMMCGLGEQWEELIKAMRDLREVRVDILTLGQYLRPSKDHLPVARFYSPREFDELRLLGSEMGFRHVESGPLVRSSYHAWEQVQSATVSG
ncbi:MAG: lipoyl synthase [Gemmatimonadetes bacterium]|nr:lipoyl synthase [Gemmatimonadota bacterium]